MLIKFLLHSGVVMTPTDGITDQTIIIPMDIIHGELKSVWNLSEITFIGFLGIHVRGSIIIIPQANTAETTGPGARGQQRLRSDSVT